MDLKQSNKLIDYLESGQNLSIVLLSHNAYWSSLQKLERRYPSLKLNIFGKSPHYIKMATIDADRQIDDCDMIVFYSSGYYTEEEMMELKNIALKISEEKGKRVTIGYSYVIPPNSEGNNIKIVSINNREEMTEEFYLSFPFGVYHLAELTFTRHNNISLEKAPKLNKTI